MNVVEGSVRVPSRTSDGGYVELQPDSVSWEQIELRVVSGKGRTDARVDATDLLAAVRWMADAVDARNRSRL